MIGRGSCMRNAGVLCVVRRVVECAGGAGCEREGWDFVTNAV